MSLNNIPLVHSEIVDSEEVARVCATKSTSLAEFHQKWEAEVAFSYYGGSAPKGAVTAFFAPECKPDRLEVFTKLVEYFFAHDDELTTTSKSHASLKVATNSIGWELRKREASGLQLTAIKQIQSEVFLQLLEIDRPRGNLVLQAINNLSQVHETLGESDFKSWEDLLQYRVQNFGAELNLMSIVYRCELDLKSTDIETLRPIWWPATAAAALVNDLYSFDKEASTELGIDTTMSNAVWYLMETLHLTVSQAKYILLKEKIQPLERQFILKKTEYVADTNGSHISADVRYFLEMVGLDFTKWTDHPQLAGCLVPNISTIRVDEATATCGTFRRGQPPRAMIGGILGNPFENSEGGIQCPYFKVLQLPMHYLRSVPSKNIRGTIIPALNVWLKAPEAVLDHVEALIGYLHDSSLLLDDIQDNSELRRGQPTVHRVFWVSANNKCCDFFTHLIFRRICGTTTIDSRASILWSGEELQNLHVGQEIDLHWTRTGQCPSITEYLEMIRLKTGALFCLAGHLIYTRGSFSADVNDLMILLGHYFQVRDDYVNLASSKYRNEKGYAQDLDEGKFSLPLIHMKHQQGLKFSEETLRSLEAKVQRQLEGTCVYLESVREYTRWQGVFDEDTNAKGR
ncbi:terpenoid synthase [Aspergillus pseudodeflectus]|uniref:Terpenoid synthase n=1 Tax=Aspergillus pseudodeflectus TaxID=176178 RepID=A0ABR4JVL5_9EURO